MDGHTTPPHVGSTYCGPKTAHTATPDVQLATPLSLHGGSPNSAMPAHDAYDSPVQTEIDADPNIKRLQQDLLILTSFNDNSTLYWRPAWFTQGSFLGNMWTFHNPPDVVTEQLPNDHRGIQLFTRRIRRANDPLPQYVKSWSHWRRYCDLYGIPHDFLSKEQVHLTRMGLVRSSDGLLRTPPLYPLYPEPLHRGSYVLPASIHSTHLPSRFQHVLKASLHGGLDSAEVIVVKSDGALVVEPHKDHFRTRLSKGHRWSYIPWTTEMERSCKPLTIKLRLWEETYDGKKRELIR